MSSKKKSNLKYVRVRQHKGGSKGFPKKFPKTFTSKNEVIFKDGGFCLSHDKKNETEEYCLFLINNTFIPPINKAVPFIDDLCNESKNVYHLLNCFEKLIVSNGTLPVFRDYKKRRILLRDFIRRRKNLWTANINRNGPVAVFDPVVVKEKRIKFNIRKVSNEMQTVKTHKKKIQFLKKRQMEYLLEVENFRNARFVRWVDMEIEILLEPKVYPDKLQKSNLETLDGLLIDLAIICGSYNPTKSKNRILDFKKVSEIIVETYCSFSCMADGSLISERILWKYINIYRKQKQTDKLSN